MQWTQTSKAGQQKSRTNNARESWTGFHIIVFCSYSLLKLQNTSSTETPVVQQAQSSALPLVSITTYDAVTATVKQYAAYTKCQLNRTDF